jgi:HK97 family phage major capsid protein
MSKLNTLRAERQSLVSEMRAMDADARRTNNGNFSPAENVLFNGLRGAIDKLEARMKAAALVERFERGPEDPEIKRAMTGRAVLADQYARAFRSYLIGGEEALSAEHRSTLKRVDLTEKRDLSLTGASGGFTVPQGFKAHLVEAQREHGAFFAPGLCTMLESDSGSTTPIPLEDDSANAAVIVAENGILTGSTDATFASANLGAFTYRSLVRVSLELLQDSAFDLEAYIARKLGIRLARGFNAHASTGHGTAQPQGLFNATVGAPIGVTAPTGRTTSWSYQSLVDIEHSVDPGYRSRAKWMFNDATLQALKKKLDLAGRPIWQPNVHSATDGNSLFTKLPGTILGYECVINQDAPVPAANARSIAFGDFSHYLIRTVRDLFLVRADQRFVEQGQVAFYLFARMDGRYANPASAPARAPIRLGQNSAT